MTQYGVIADQKPAGAIEIANGANYQQIVNNAPAGSTFWFDAGTYREVSIQPKDGDTFLGAPGAVLNGSELITSFTKSGSAWVISNQDQQGARNLTDHGAPGAQNPGYPETVFEDDKPLTPVSSLGNLKAGDFYFDYASHQIYLGSDPTGHTVETGQSAQAFSGSASNVTIKDLTIEKYDSPAQIAAVDGKEGTGWTIENNDVSLCYGVGISVGTNGQIIGNNVHDNGEMGLNTGGNNILVQGNDLASNGYWSGIDMSWEGGGAKFSSTTNAVIQNNYVHDNAGNGLWSDINDDNVTYNNNLLMDNAYAGIADEISYAGTIKDNVAIGNGYGSGPTPGNPTWLWGAGILIHNSQDTDVYGNYVNSTNAGNGITLPEESRGSGDMGPYLVENDSIHDNTIVQASGNGRSGGESNINDAAYRADGNTWNNNAFYTADGHFDWGNSSQNTFAEFEAATKGTNTLAPASSAPAQPDLSQWMPTSGSATTTPTPTPTPAPDPTPTPAPTPAPTPTPTPTPPSVGDTLILGLSEDAYKGDAQFTVAVDGKTLNSPTAVTASHDAGQIEDFSFKGSFGAGPHTVAVDFLNDLYAGSAGDRNLYVKTINYNGTNTVENHGMYVGGVVDFKVG